MSWAVIKIKYLWKRLSNISIFYDEHGFSTLTVVVSLLISLSLIFSTAQVYRISSASADVQNVSDSSALAAQNEVAEFMLLVKVNDATILSLGLCGIITTGLGLVALCTPVTAVASEALLNAAQKILEARDNFANDAAKSLNTIQKSLPFLSSVKAYQIAALNNGGSFSANYMSIALLMPGEGIEINPGNIDAAKNTLNDINSRANDIRDAAQKAEDAAKAANEAKLKAFIADCGGNPNYCMYERAKNKAFMTGSNNPLYNNVDNWTFSVPLNRSKAYYPTRLNIEKPAGSSINEQANSNLRKVFYSYASNQMSSAYVYEYEDDFDAYFPHLPKNTDEMRQTTIYTDPCFPVSSNADGLCMHAYSGCPGCGSVSYYGSISNMESGGYKQCEYCKFSASSMGKVASASTAINNGYEYHYSIVENAAREYKAAKDAIKPLNAKVKGFAENFLNILKNLIKDIANKRIYAKPPGSYGAICMTVNTSSAPASNGFESSFVKTNATLGVRAAVSGVTMIEEESAEGKDVLNSFTNGIKDKMPGIAGPLGIVLNAWSKILQGYNKGQDALIDSIETSLNQLPLVSASGLGTWAAKKMKTIMETCGLEPVNLKALKPVLINSFYVANEENKENPNTSAGYMSKSFAIKYLTIKDKAATYNELSNQVLSGVSNGNELLKAINLEEAFNSNGSIELAVIKPLGDLGPSIPIVIKLPKSTTNTLNNIVSQIAGALQSILGSAWGGKIWR